MKKPSKLKRRLAPGFTPGVIQPSVSPIGGLLEGLMSGFLGHQQLLQQQEDIKLRKEKSKLEQKMLDLKLKEMEQKQGGLSNLSNLLTGGVPATGPTLETDVGDQPIGNVPRPDLPNAPAGRQDIIGAMAKTPGLEDEAAKAAIAPAPFDPAKFMTGGGAPSMAGLPLSGVNIGPSGPSYRFGEQRQALSADNQLWAKLLQKHGGDFEKARAEYNIEVQKTFGAKAQAPFDAKANPANQQTETKFKAAGATGSALGKLGVEQTPEFQATERQTAESRKLGGEAGDARVKLAGLADASAIVDELDQLSSKLITATTGMEANAQAVKLFGQKTLQGGSPAALYEQRKKNLAESLARNIGGVKGTATEGDIERMIGGVPGFRETKQSRDYKINAIRGIIGVAIENQKRLISGEPIDLEAARTQFKGLVDNFLQQGSGAAQPSGRWERVQ